ncbi:alpha-galactosidase [Enterococcus sp. AZ194]|uniref:alpha-galactosidase n=1 Tax=Enterococcus sp. AZ194 TaxID=2774629 RepID=UPI003F2697B9
MTIHFDENKRQFHLFNESISYVMELYRGTYLLQTYFGERIQAFTQSLPYPLKDRSSFSPNPKDWPDRGFSLDSALQEIPGYDTGDYRESICAFTFCDGTKAVGFSYLEHTIFQGKKALDGLPATYVEDDEEAETLEITMIDAKRQLKAVLSYTIFAKRSVITKSIRYQNMGNQVLYINKALSSCLDLPDANFDLLQLPGAWANEKQLKRDRLSMGVHVLDSKRGASSVMQQPFMALMRPEANEHSGEVYGFHFVYSGNFKMATEFSFFEQTRVLIGINDHNFSWKLGANEIFQTPEVVCVYSNKGLNSLSSTFHKLYRERLARGFHKYQERPILINNWESTYFDFTEEKLLAFTQKAQKLGVELFVLDDGWFEGRNSDTTSLGDWIVDKKKLPGGLKQLAKKIQAEGLKFGLWFEPEMISENSQLFEQHPDWHLHVTDYPSSIGRNQYVLDFSRSEVREEIYRQVTQILDNVPIDYIKWDMNRNMTEVASVLRETDQQMETSHRYILGLYEFLEKLTNRYPTILFENCSGGGGRFDPGMVYYMPQSWVSDNTDAVERLKIQYGNSLIFPSVMTCAHLSAVPNHQVGRITPLDTRAAVAMSANFGLMIDLEKESSVDIDKIAEYLQWYKKNRQLLQFGDFYRLLSPFESNHASWVFVNEEKSKAILFFFEILANANKPFIKVKLKGLQESAVYQIQEQTYTGDELMKFGLYLNEELFGDFQSKIIEINRIDSF